MATCPCCSDILLRHIRSHKTYLYCRRCRLEILEATSQKLSFSKVSSETPLEQCNQPTYVKA